MTELKLIILSLGFVANWVLFGWAMGGFKESLFNPIVAGLAWIAAIYIVLEEYEVKKTKGKKP